MYRGTKDQNPGLTKFCDGFGKDLTMESIPENESVQGIECYGSDLRRLFSPPSLHLHREGERLDLRGF